MQNKDRAKGIETTRRSAAETAPGATAQAASSCSPSALAGGTQDVPTSNNESMAADKVAGWLGYEKLRQLNLMAVDAAGRKIDRVRAAREEGTGIRVRVLGTVQDGILAVLGDKPQLAVEFEGHIIGGRLARREEVYR